MPGRPGGDLCPPSSLQQMHRILHRFGLHQPYFRGFLLVREDLAAGAVTGVKSPLDRL